MSNPSQYASNASMESMFLSMQRLELNLTQSMEIVLNRLNSFETKMETMQRQFADYQNGQTQALTKSLTGVAEQLQKVTVQALQFATPSVASSYVPKPNAPDPIQANVSAPSERIKSEIGPKASNEIKPPSTQSFGGQFNIKEGEWDCKTCYVRNQPTATNCVSCGTGKDTEEKSSNAPAFKPTTFATNSTFSFGTGQPLFGGKNVTPSSQSAAPKGAALSNSSEVKSLFGNVAKPTFAPPSNSTQFSALGSVNSFDKNRGTTELNQPKSIFGSAASNASTTHSFVSFGGTSVDKKPLNTEDASFALQKSQTSAPSNETPEDNENPEEYVPDVHYVPVIPLPDKVQVVTGEESEQILFKDRAKLYIFNSETKEVKERGIGDLKLLYNPETKAHRVVMRREQVHKICANFRICQGMSISDKTGSKNCGIFNCKDFSDEDPNGTNRVFIVRFKDDDIYKSFKKLFMDIAAGTSKNINSETKVSSNDIPSSPQKSTNQPKSEIKPPSAQSFGGQFNIKEGEWDCKTCYVRNQPTASACVSCGTGKDAEEKPSNAPAFKPTTFATNSTFSFGTGQPLFGVKSTTPSSQNNAPSDIASAKIPEGKSLFGGGVKPSFSFAPPSTSSPFSSSPVTSPFAPKPPTSESNLPKSIFGSPAINSTNKTPLSFATFGSGSSFLDKKLSNTNDNSFGAQKSQTFQSSPANQTQEDNENPEEYVPDVHYEPVVPLPDKVQVVTGEEAEEVKFKNRAKIYVFNSETKEVKERGVGDLKVLYNPETKTHRVVMRREQVHKLCANFRINQGMSIADKTGSKNCGIFNCKDYSDDATNGKDFIFIVRFKDEDIYESFKKLFMDISTGNNPPASETSLNVIASGSNLNTTAPSLPNIGFSNDSYDEEEAYEDEYDEEGENNEEEFDEETEDQEYSVYEVNCNKLTLSEPYKSPLSKGAADLVYDDAKLVIDIVDDNNYQVAFIAKNEEADIFPHLIRPDAEFHLDGNKISFVARDLQGSRKRLTCEFKDENVAKETLASLNDSREHTSYTGEDE